MEYKSDYEIRLFLDELDTAQADGSSWGMLRKGEFATRNVSALGQDASLSIGTLGMRAVYHSDRLLEQGRSEQERNFALALAENAAKLLGRMRNGAGVRETVSGEGSDCCLWWTLSPYIFDELKAKVGEEEALKAVLKWAKTGRTGLKIKGREVNLSGLGDYNYAGFNHTFTLSEDPNGASHRFARQEAQRLVRDVFSAPQSLDDKLTEFLNHAGIFKKQS